MFFFSAFPGFGLHEEVTSNNKEKRVHTICEIEVQHPIAIRGKIKKDARMKFGGSAPVYFSPIAWTTDSANALLKLFS